MVEGTTNNNANANGVLSSMTLRPTSSIAFIIIIENKTNAPPLRVGKDIVQSVWIRCNSNASIIVIVVMKMN